MDAKEIGKNIKRLRKLLGLTQAELAARLGVTYQAVSRWENGNNTPDLQVLLKIKEVFNVTVDELLLQETPFETVYEEKNWAVRFFLFPILLLGLTFCIGQFVLFLNTTFSMFIIAMFLDALLILVMIFVKVKDRKRFYLCFTLGLFIAAAILYFPNKRYFNLMEVPELKEVSRVESSFPQENIRPESVMIQTDDLELAVMYNPGYENFYIYDLSQSLEHIESIVDTDNQPVSEMEVVGNYLYYASYLPYDYNFVGEFNLYRYQISTGFIELMFTDDLPYGLFTNGIELSLFDVPTDFTAIESSVYKLVDHDIVLQKSYDFMINDVKYTEPDYVYSVSVLTNLLASNLYRMNEFYEFENKYFEEDIFDNITITQDDYHVIAVINTQLYHILNNMVQSKDIIVSDAGSIHVGGFLYYTYGGSLMNSNFEELNSTIFYDDSWNNGDGFILFESRNGNTLISVSEGYIYELKHYYKQVNEMLIASFLRHGLFFGSLPFISLIVTAGLTKVTQRKTKK